MIPPPRVFAFENTVTWIGVLPTEDTVGPCDHGNVGGNPIVARHDEERW